MLEDLTISDIHSLGKAQAIEVLSQITRIEKKTFPASEAYPFGEELWRKKPNTKVLYVTQASQGPLIAYALYVRQKGVAFLHKVCVAEAFRGKGVGMRLMKYIRARLEKEGCQHVHLWVDKARGSARSLYIRNGFEEYEVLVDYYAPGRDGIKMVLDLERDR
ncbi:acyl-CoA N-acyltransferase [Aspergillus unguis]